MVRKRGLNTILLRSKVSLFLSGHSRATAAAAATFPAATSAGTRLGDRFDDRIEQDFHLPVLSQLLGNWPDLGRFLTEEVQHNRLLIEQPLAVDHFDGDLSIGQKFLTLLENVGKSIPQ